MADISKCTGAECSKKETCYRYTAISHPWWQSYFSVAPINVETQECDFYWENEDE